MRILLFTLALLVAQTSFGKDSKSEKQDAHFVLGINYLKGSSSSTGSDPVTQKPKKWSLTSEGFGGHFGMVGSSGLAILGVVDYLDTYSDRDSVTKTRYFSENYLGLGWAVGYDGPFWKLILQGTQGHVKTSASVLANAASYDASSGSITWGYNLLKGDSAGSVSVFTTLREQYLRSKTVGNDVTGQTVYSALLGIGMQFNADSVGIALIQALLDSSRKK